MTNIPARPKLHFENVNIKIKDINYQSLDSKIPNGKIILNDKYDIESISKKEILMYVQRTVTTDPNKIFELKVKIELKLPLNQKDHKFDGSIEELREYIKKNVLIIINNSSCMQTVSLLISQITSAYARVPVITPPNFISNISK